MKIKAYAIKNKGGKAEPFFYEKRLGANDVLVNVTHCGIPQGDIHFIDDDLGDTKFPLVTGQEIVGVVEETGSAVTSIETGDRAGIGYQQEACFGCQYCREGNEQFCPQQKVIGLDSYGGLAEQIIVDSRFAFKIPEKLDSAKSTPLVTSGLTVYAAIARAKLQPNSEVAVLGVGGLGHLAIQFLHKMGHVVSAFSHSPEKKEIIKRLGADYVDSTNPKSLSGYDRKFDFIISTLNVNFALDLYLKMLKPQGKFCLVGLPLNKLSLDSWLLSDYAQRTIYGNYIGSRKDMKDMLTFSAKHSIEGIVEVMPFSKMNEAIEMVRRKKVPIRLVLENRK